MYFSATIAGHSHLWRQRYPRGVPEQITFGPTEEVGVAAAPDGRSLVTSLGLQRQSIWIHDSNGERPVTSDGIASAPWLSADAKRLYFLVASASDAPASLWRRDLQHGQEEPMLPGREPGGGGTNTPCGPSAWWPACTPAAITATAIATPSAGATK